MSDLSITAASVQPSAGAVLTATAAVAISAGQAIYLDSTTTPANQAKLAIANGTQAQAACVGIAVGNAAAGQPVNYQNSGSVTIGGTVVKTTVYVVSAATAGDIAPISDLSSGNYLTILGYADTTSSIAMTLKATGVTH